DPNFGLTHFWLWYACTETGLYSDAENELERARSVYPHLQLAFSAYAEAKAGDKLKARRTLAQLLRVPHREPVRPVVIAYIYIALGEKDQAFAWLEKAYLAKSPDLEALKNLPAFDPLRPDPRFADLIRRVGLQP